MTQLLRLVKPYITQNTGLTVRNPATGAVIATVTDTDIDSLDKTIQRAESQQKSWAGQTAKIRAGILMQWRRLIIDHIDELAAIVTAECGKPLAEARGEVTYGASFIEWFAEEGKRLYGDIIPSHAAGKRILVMKQPVGVVAAITPWNFPVAMITRKVAPALSAGCSIIVKPAEATPLSALALETLAVQAGLPEGLFKVVPTTRPVDIGKILTTHPSIRKFSFTGSTPVGRLLMAQCASTIKKVSLELGGNAPFIVFDDADIDAAVSGAVASKYRNAGQTCVCTNRFLVQEAVYEEFTTKFAAAVSRLQVGDGASGGTEIGPLINAAERDRVAVVVSEAVDAGARVLVGGSKHSKGDTYYQPTVLADVRPEMSIVNAEIFGPVAPIIKFREEADAIRIANDTPFGLASYFYANDLGRVWRVAEALEYGMVGINEGIISTEVAPFGGMKQSGLGREGSKYGIDDYVETKYCLMGGL